MRDLPPPCFFKKSLGIPSLFQVVSKQSAIKAGAKARIFIAFLALSSTTLIKNGSSQFYLNEIEKLRCIFFERCSIALLIVGLLQSKWLYNVCRLLLFPSAITGHRMAFHHHTTLSTCLYCTNRDN